MSEAIEYDIGAPVSCSDGACGELVRVVLDPVARAVTHIIVAPEHGRGQERLVPVDLVEESVPGIRLRCSLGDFDELELAEETHFFSAGGGDLGYGDGEVSVWPYYGLGPAIGGGMPEGPWTYLTSRVPAGEVEVRRGEQVHATDGGIGRVQGLVIDPSDHHVTHVLLQEGHLWGKKEVAIPMGSVKSVDAEGVHLDLRTDDVRDLPPVALADRG
ncbi:MAG TPA: PRC-barrel domain-containing protein [Solirubrobacteraceae bacterium]|nr:PRC-barrel domain-containing protein [Solirubrobacteraceae bacterium]